MRHIKLYIVAALLFLNASVTFAQAPGYMGKKFIIGYDLYTFPALRNPNAKGNTGFTSLNYRHEISVDYVTTLSQSVGISLQLTKTKFEFKRSFEDANTATLINYGGTIGELSAVGIGLHTHLYFNEYIAPQGSYFKPEVLLLNFRVKYDSVEAKKHLIENTGYSGNSLPGLQNNKSYSTIAIGGTFGTHRIFFDRLIFDIGFQFGIVFGGKVLSGMLAAGDDYSTPSSSINASNFLKVSGKSRLYNQYFMNINAGLAFLIF